MSLLRKDCEQRHKFWLEEDLPQGIKARFLKDAHQAAVGFFELADRQLLPAISAGDRVATQDALRKLEERYLEHRQAIDDVVALSTRELQEVSRARRRVCIPTCGCCWPCSSPHLARHRCQLPVRPLAARRHECSGEASGRSGARRSDFGNVRRQPS